MRFAAMMLVLACIGSCDTPLCASGNYRQGECRVLAENQLGRFALTDGTELRFQEPTAEDDGSWTALGLFTMRDGAPRARPAGLGDFAISITPGKRTVPLELELENVATDATLVLGPFGAEVALDAPADGLHRRVQIPPSAETLWLRGQRACPASFRLAALGDPQSNPLQFERILEQLILEKAAGADAEEPLLGLLVLGDLTESSTAFEFQRVHELIQRSPVPVAVTVGNHDIYDDQTARYNAMFGPGNYAMDLCSARVVLLDSGNGALPISVEARLSQLLNLHGREHLVVGTHYPPYAALLSYGWGDENQAWHLLAEEARQASSVLNLTGHFHSWREFPKLPIGGRTLAEVMTGTGGGDQGLGVPQYGYTRVTISDTLSWCFVQTPVPGGVELHSGRRLTGHAPLHKPVNEATMRMSSQLSSSFADLPVIRASDGARIAIGESFREKPALLLFIRRFGCIACSEWVTEIAPQLVAFERLGITTLMIGSGTTEEGRAFAERFALTHQPMQLVNDPTLATFKAMGLIQTWWGTYGLPAVWPLLRALAEGHRNRPKGGDGTQLGGVFLVEPGGAVAFSHRSAHFGDNPKMPDLIEAIVKSVAKKGVA